MINDNNELIKYRIERSFETIREAKTMIDNKFWNASINRIYCGERPSAEEKY